MHQSFIESIGGEESPAASDCIMLLDQHGFDPHQLSALSSEETNGHQHLLLLPCTTLHLMPHQHDGTKYLVTIHSL